METISACPHHGFDTWMLVNHFYDGISPSMKQLLETMCGGDFLSKHPDEAMDFLNYVAETSKAWDEPNPREAERSRPSNHKKGHICTFRRHGDGSKADHFDSKVGGAGNEKSARNASSKRATCISSILFRLSDK